MSVIVTIRIPRSLREEAKKYNIKISEVLRRALREEIERRRQERIKELQKKAEKILSKIDKKEILEVLREIRSER